MRYLLMLYADEIAGSKIPPADMGKYMDQMYAYKAALEKAGAFVDTHPLAPTSQACTVRMHGGEMKVHDGPYAETREQFGGYFIIQAPDMDAARTWAARCPAATWGSIEVRQIVSHSRP